MEELMEGCCCMTLRSGCLNVQEHTSHFALNVQEHTSHFARRHMKYDDRWCRRRAARLLALLAVWHPLLELYIAQYDLFECTVTATAHMSDTQTFCLINDC
jgi:hypothetical protein